VHYSGKTPAEITGAISGLGAAQRLSAVRWNVTLNIVWSWLFTIPGAAIIGSMFFLFLTNS
jgi:PiT family inorganic phosphate transporter